MAILAYSTIKSVREMQISEAKMSDSEVLKLIHQYSASVSRLVNSWFVPVNVKQRFNGGGNVIYTGLPPVIKLFSANIVEWNQSRTLIDPLEYDGVGKIIRFKKRTQEGIKNIEIDGLFGHIDNNKVVPVKTTTDISQGSVSFGVEDASELEERDVFIFNNRVIIANSIDYENNTVIIDKQLSSKIIESGSETICFGCVPFDIERAINLMIKNGKKLEKLIGGKLKSEKTDDYEYEVFQSGDMSTGIPEVDRILQTYLEGEVTINYF
ncbi:MAG: hypothetical protein K0Q47_8 [Sedimentibacter sp.]|jgi:hypothetical protein|nr:hypothetical protein [Sedimentibacter sp.]